MVKKTILFGSLRGSTSASLKMGEILAILKWQVFEIGGRTYFMLLVDRIYYLYKQNWL